MTLLCFGLKGPWYIEFFLRVRITNIFALIRALPYESRSIFFCGQSIIASKYLLVRLLITAYSKHTTSFFDLLHCQTLSSNFKTFDHKYRSGVVPISSIFRSGPCTMPLELHRHWRMTYDVDIEQIFPIGFLSDSHLYYTALRLKTKNFISIIILFY